MKSCPRILIIDDTISIHDDFRKILCGPPQQEFDLDCVEAQLFGRNQAEPAVDRCEIISAYQGEEGLDAVREAEASARPFALAFVDMRMPPGWDGLETVIRLWEAAPDLQIVICTAYSDHSWAEIATRLGQNDKFVILKKPFDVVEVIQLAHALTTKWALLQESKQYIKDLDDKIQKRTQELIQSETRYRVLFESMLEGFAYCRVLFEDGRPQDFLHLEVNQAFERLTGLKDVVGKK